MLPFMSWPKKKKIADTTFESAVKKSSEPRGRLNAPARPAEVSDLHVEEGEERVPAEGAGGVEVGVVGRPARHDLLVVHQAVARLTAGTAGDQQLEEEEEDQGDSQLNQGSSHGTASIWVITRVVVTKTSKNIQPY